MTDPAPQAAARLSVRTEGSTATVVIDNPAKRNAMTPDMWRQLPPLLDRLEADPAIRVLVLRGAGETFCAGADLGDLDGLLAAGDGSVAVVAEERLATFAKPTIARISGACVGGGCQLAVACDLRIAATGSRFGVPPARLGLVYPAPTTRRLVGLIGPSATKHLLFTAELIEADRALAVGLVDEVTDRLDARVGDIAEAIAARSQLTVVAAKEIVGMAVAGRIEPDRVAGWHRLARDSGEAAEGVAAVTERRPATFRWTLSPPTDA